MLCVRCGQTIPEGSRFCSFCGKRQISAPAPQRRARRRPKGSGTVYKSPGRRTRPWGAYAADRTPIGYYATSTDAVAALDAFNAKKLSARSATRTFAEIYSAWSSLHYQTIGPSGRSSYEAAYDKARPLWNRRMADLKTEDYQEIIETLKATGLSRSMCEKQRQLFSQLCKYAMQQDIIHTNYAEGLRLPASQEQDARVLTDEEIERIRRTVPDKRLGETARITLALIYTGMRLNELLLARVENYHGDYLVAGEKTAAGRDRVIPIHAAVRPYFDAWAAGRDTGFLLCTPNGTPRDHNNVRKSFTSLMRKLEIPNAHPHTCRHTAATRMAASGILPEVVKQILGHADIATTLNIYTHPDTKILIEAIKSLH